MFSQMYLDNIEQTIFLCNTVLAWSMQHCIGYFPHKSCLLAMDKHYIGDFLVQCWPRQSCKVVLGLWINIAQLVFVCNVGTGRSRQHCIGYFPAKACLSALGQYCTSNFLVQCSLRYIWATLTKQYSCVMLSQHGRYKISQVIFLIKVICQPQTNIAQVVSLCNVGPDRSRQRCRSFLCKVVCEVWTNIVQVFFLCNVGSGR